MNFNQAFGIHAQALQLKSQRSEVLAANIANADTPNFKARDFDFQAALTQANNDFVRLRTTHIAHLEDEGQIGQTRLQYRIPFQPSADGNTVEVDTEQAKFSENTLGYQASLRFLDGRIKGLLSSIRGRSN